MKKIGILSAILFIFPLSVFGIGRMPSVQIGKPQLYHEVYIVGNGRDAPCDLYGDASALRACIKAHDIRVPMTAAEISAYPTNGIIANEDMIAATATLIGDCQTILTTFHNMKPPGHGDKNSSFYPDPIIQPDPVEIDWSRSVIGPSPGARLTVLKDWMVLRLKRPLPRASCRPALIADVIENEVELKERDGNFVREVSAVTVSLDADSNQYVRKIENPCSLLEKIPGALFEGIPSILLHNCNSEGGDSGHGLYTQSGKLLAMHLGAQFVQDRLPPGTPASARTNANVALRIDGDLLRALMRATGMTAEELKNGRHRRPSRR